MRNSSIFLCYSLHAVWIWMEHIILIKNDINVRKCFQVLYICSECDFVSYFAHLGKGVFFKTIYQFATFISGHQSPSTPGDLSQTTVGIDSDLGLLAFYRLILCVYFIANRACLHNYTSPVELFSSITASTIQEHHSKALDIVRRASWKGTYEDQLLPSDEALRLHWLRSCWVSTVWNMVRTPKFDYPDITKYGYKVSHNDGAVIVEFEWDSVENMSRVKEKVLCAEVTTSALPTPLSTLAEHAVCVDDFLNDLPTL